MKNIIKRNYKLYILSIIILSSLILELNNISSSLGNNYIYVIKPLIWCFIGIITFVFFKNDVVPNNKYEKQVEFYVIIAALSYFLIYFIIGYFNGFANNPYDQSFNGFLINIWTFLPILIVKEYTRYYMINNCQKKYILLHTFFISLLFSLLNLNISKMALNFSDSYTTMQFFLESFIPNLIISLYLTYICYYANYKASITYQLLPQLVIYLLPILPNVNWLLLSILNVSVPFFSYVYINYQINKIDKTIDKRVYKTVDIKGWLVMILIVLLMVLFGLGIFPYKPLVIASNSMYPQIKKGDIVIISNIDPDKIKVGDVVRYQIQNYYVVHRVYAIKKQDDNSRLFIFKGDNNISIDLYPVKEYQIKGIIRYKIPYLGYPTIFLSHMLNTDVDSTVEVETGN